MNKSLVFFLTVIAVGLGAIIYAEANTISELNRKMTELRAKEAALNAVVERDREEIAKLQNQIATFREESEALRKRLASGTDAADAGAIPGGKAPAPAAAGESKGAWMKNLAKMFSDPEMKKSMKSQQAMGIRMMYGDLFKELGLSAQDSEQLADILAERQMELSAAAMAGMNGDKPDPDQLKKITDAKERYDEQLKATLGEANYKKLDDYEKTIGDRFMLQQYEGHFASAGAPLEPKQRESLLQIMQEERMKMPKTPFDQNATTPQPDQFEALKDQGTVDRYFAQQEEMNRRVLERARKTLSADQIGALQKGQQQTTDLIRGQMKMSQELFGK